MKEIVNIMIYSIVIFISVIFCNLCYAKLNGKKMNISLKNIGIMYITSILLFFNTFLYSIGIKAIINLLCFSLELKLIFKDNNKRIVINYIFIYLVISLTEIIVTKTLLHFGFLIDNSSANTVSYITLELTIIVGVIIYCLISIKLIRNCIYKAVNFFFENKTITNIIYIIFVTIATLSMIYIEYFTTTYSFRLILLLFIIFIVLFSIIIRLEFNTSVLKVKNKKLLAYNENYGKFLEEYKIYKHNINYKLKAIKAYGNKKVNALIDDLLKEENEFSIRNNEIYKVPNGIKGLIAEKLYNKNYDVVINNKINKDPFKKLSAKSFNSISECLGIALDNAIEAAEATKNPFIVIELNEDENNIYIKVTNPYCNKIDIDKIGEKNYSTKERDSGYGLFTIRNNKYVEDEIIITNGTFNIELKLSKSKK